MNHITLGWHTQTVQETLAAQESSASQGLSGPEAVRRLAIVGLNQLTSVKRDSFWQEFLEELREPMVLLLLVTGGLYAVWGELSDALTIFGVILVLNTIEVINEQRSKKAIAGLHKLAEPTALVLRAGLLKETMVQQIVPGDVFRLEPGRRVPADGRLVEGFSLAVDESTLTGESLPVEKDAAAVLPAETALAERSCLVYSGTLVASGHGAAVAVATGAQSEIGRIAGLARQLKEPRTPLQKAMGELSGWLVWLALGFSVVVPVLGVVLAHRPLQEMLLTGLSLAFATIPEEMPIIISMALALGAARLAKRHAIVKRLKVVETLGSVTVIVTDKTGTLTENRMEVARLEPPEHEKQLLELGVLCNQAVPSGAEFVGDPLDAALLRAAGRSGLDPQVIRRQYPVQAEFSFDPFRKRASSVVRKDSRLWSVVKGAPESILARSAFAWQAGQRVALDEAGRAGWVERAAELAGQGLRVLALAEVELEIGAVSAEQAETDLTLAGLIGLADLPRPEARGAIAACQKAGIRVIMVTGDHPITARAIAGMIGLDSAAPLITGPELDRMSVAGLIETMPSTQIFARTSPEHKLRIVQALEGQGDRVAVTGDGINDAPALVAADIGIAMGETGSDVARESSDIVLADDNFNTIVAAVEEGRLLYENLKKGVRYYLACKVALVSATLLPVLLGAPVPFAPVQIILMELFMDLAATAAFVAEPAEVNLLDRPPRDPRARFMDGSMGRGIFSAALGLFAAVSSVYLVTWFSTANLAAAQTAAFGTWLLGHVLLAYNLRSETEPVFGKGRVLNRWMMGWGAATGAFLIVLAVAPPVQQLFKAAALPPATWGWMVLAAIAGTFWMEVWKWVRILTTKVGIR